MTDLDPAPEYDPVRGFLGCLMATTAGRARELLAGMRPADAGPGIRGVVMGLVVSVVAAGTAPDPRVLLAEAQRRGLLDTESRHQRFAHWLADTHRSAPFPEAARRLRGAVLETAFRRAARERALRLLQAAEHSGVVELQALLDHDDELVGLWQRLAADLRAQGREHDPALVPVASWETGRAA